MTTQLSEGLQARAKYHVELDVPMDNVDPHGVLALLARLETTEEVRVALHEWLNDLGYPDTAIAEYLRSMKVADDLLGPENATIERLVGERDFARQKAEGLETLLREFEFSPDGLPNAWPTPERILAALDAGTQGTPPLRFVETEGISTNTQRQIEHAILAWTGQYPYSDKGICYLCGEIDGHKDIDWPLGTHETGETEYATLPCPIGLLEAKHEQATTQRHLPVLRPGHRPRAGEGTVPTPLRDRSAARLRGRRAAQGWPGAGEDIRMRPPLPKQGQIITVDYLNKLGACHIPDWLIQEFPAIEGRGITLNRKNLYRAARAAHRAGEDLSTTLAWVLLNRFNVREDLMPISSKFVQFTKVEHLSDQIQVKTLADILGLR